MRAKIFVPAAAVLAALGIGGLVLYSPNHSACSSILVQATNESLCRTDSTVYIISWALIAVAILITLGQIASLTQSRNSSSSAGHTTNAKFCISCGKPIDINSAFCPQCGATVAPINSIVDVETLQNDERPPAATETEVVALTETTATKVQVNNKPMARRGPTRRSFLISTVIILVLVVSGGAIGYTIKNHSSSTLVKTATTPVTNASSGLFSVRLPLIVCKTTYGIPTMKAANLPTTLTELVPRGTGVNMSVYSDAQGIMKLIGPPGWGCTAGIGADGSGVVTIAPTDSSIWNTTNYSGTLSVDSTVEEINGTQNGACNGCGLAQACPLFTTAWYKYHNSGSNCPTTAPSSELSNQLTKNVISFSDPPGVHGDANPSGGVYTARGVMTYFANELNSSWMETCLLPPGEQSLCSATLSNFAYSYGRK